MRLLKILLLFMFLAGIAYSQDEKKVFTAAVDKDGVQKVSVTGGSYFYDPAHIIVKVNVPVELSVRKEPGIAPHSFVIKAPEAGMDINEALDKDPKVIKFVPQKTGKYPFYCDRRFLFFRTHRDKGMEGVMEVVE